MAFVIYLGLTPRYPSELISYILSSWSATSVPCYSSNILSVLTYHVFACSILYPWNVLQGIYLAHSVFSQTYVTLPETTFMSNISKILLCHSLSSWFFFFAQYLPPPDIFHVYWFIIWLLLLERKVYEVKNFSKCSESLYQKNGSNRKPEFLKNNFFWRFFEFFFFQILYISILLKGD